jgi:hypothetical protein
MGLWWGTLKEEDHLEDLGIDGSILNWVLNRMEGPRLDSNQSWALVSQLVS